MPIDDPADYGRHWSQSYDRLYEGRDDTGVIVGALSKVTTGRRLLEMGIGTGRLALPLAAAGFDVTGIDTAEEMLTALRSKPGSEAIRLELGDIRSARLGESFDIVLVAFSTLFLVPDQAGQVATMVTAAAHLSTDGVAIIEAFVPDHARWIGTQRVSLSRWSDEETELEAARHDRATQTIDVRYLSFGSAEIRSRPLHLRYAWPAEIDLMAQLAGLRLRTRWAAWNGTPVASESGNVISIYEHADTASPATNA